MQKSCNTVYLRNMVCCRYVIVNTVRKRCKKYNDNNYYYNSVLVY